MSPIDPPKAPTQRAPTLLPLIALLGAACAGPAPEIRREPAPDLVTAEQQHRTADAARRDFNNVLLQIDQAMESYVGKLSNRGIPRADLDSERLEKFLREAVAGKPPGTNTERLKVMAADGSDKTNQGIALAALGFAEGTDVMPIILQGAQLDDPLLVDRAILGLALRRDPNTPPGVIAAVIEDKDHPELGRIQAAWALCWLQETSYRVDEIVPVWRRILEQGEQCHPLILVQAVRGLGLTRKADDAELVARFTAHPVAKVREAAAIALGRMNAQKHYEKLLELLGPGETTPNVRLAARKALQALAGGAVDRGYEINQWRREFDRGNK
jgi:HEAT repeat protein